MGWIRDRFNGWIQGWVSSWQQTQSWSGNVLSVLFDIMIAIAIIGVLLNITGFKKVGNKMILGTILLAILIETVALYV
jgi:hypothetical protein